MSLKLFANLILLCLTSVAHTQITSNGYMIYNDNESTQVDGKYLNDSDYQNDINYLDPLNFTLKFEFKAKLYRKQWPIILGKYYRIIGLVLYEDHSVGLSLNNQRKYIPSNAKYEINQFYKVKISYNRGRINLYINNNLIVEANAEINKQWPKSDYKICSCNFSNSTCFNGIIRNLKIFNNDPSALLDWDKKYSYTDVVQLIKNELSYEKK